MSKELYEFGKSLPDLRPLIALLNQAGYIKYGNAQPEQFEKNGKFLVELARRLFFLDTVDGEAVLHYGRRFQAVETDHNIILCLQKPYKGDNAGNKLRNDAAAALDSCDFNWNPSMYYKNNE